MNIPKAIRSLKSNGFYVLLVSERLGHENVSTTLNIYSHLFPSKQSEVAERLEKLCEKDQY